VIYGGVSDDDANDDDGIGDVYRLDLHLDLDPHLDPGLDSHLDPQLDSHLEEILNSGIKTLQVQAETQQADFLLNLL
jgi:hypothetical protein